MKLNIGCSVDTWGDVRLDISRDYLSSESTANIYGDAQRIPFNDRAFNETKAWNVLEHLPDWKLAVFEWCRVTDNKLEIMVPIDAGFKRQELFAELFSFNFLYIAKLPSRRKEHLWQFTPQNLMKELNAYGFESRLSFESSILFFRDGNRLSLNPIIKLIRRIQRGKIKFGYLITAYRIKN